MGARRIPKNQREIERLLDDAGITYRIDSGQKHRKLYVAGELALVFSHGAHSSNDLRQINSLINRTSKC
jgi:hypothetical protein